MQSSIANIKHLVKEKAQAFKLANKDESLKEYLERKFPDGKKQLCRFYIRGSCIFTAEQCHFAHGVLDLIFDKPDLELFKQRLQNIDPNEERKSQEERILEEFYTKKTRDQRRKEQPGLSVGASCQILYDYHFEMVKWGELEKPFTLEEVDSDLKIRTLIKDAFQRDLQQELTSFFFTIYGERFLPKTFIELCFLTIGWFPKFRKIVNSYCCYEIAHPLYGTVLAESPEDEEFEQLIEDCLIKILKKHNLLQQQIPIKSSVVLELYQKDLMKNDPFLPHYNYYMFRRNVQADDLLQEIQKNSTFIQKLQQEFGETLPPQIFEHEKDTNLQQRQKILEKYKSKELPDRKSQFCRFFLRGLCILDASECNYAHGVEDLAFQKVSIEEYDGKYCDGKREEEYKQWEKNWADILREKQPSLNLEFTYKILYSYQFKALEQQILDVQYKQEQIDEDDSVRHLLTVLLLVDLTKEFVDFLFKTYNRKFLRKSFIDKCVQSVGWLTNWGRITNDDFCYEAKDPKAGAVILKIPELEEFHHFIENCIVKIIKDNSLLNQLPISATTISKHFYKDLFPQDPLMPTLNVFFKKTRLGIDEYLISLHSNQQFLSKLMKECNVSEEYLKDLVLFDSTATELHNLMIKMKKVVSELIEKSRSGFILFSRFEEAVKKKCTKEITRFHQNATFLRKLMRGMALTSGVLIVELLSEDYLFSPTKLKNFDFETLSKKYLAKLNTKCKRKDTNSKSHSSHHYPLIIEQSPPSNDSDLDQEINLQKIKVVDDEPSLKEAKQHINQFDTLAIDLEGNLSKGGYIELVQVACGQRIFVFDVYKLKESPELSLVYAQTLDFIREFMQNEKICKVFHDCRKDSLALHYFANSCLANVFDVSAIHILIQHLTIYSAFKEDLFPSPQEESKNESENEKSQNEMFEKSIEILNFIDDIKAPGLNEVLKAYGASHGINHLKTEMKKKFEEMPREYFLKRPLNREYLIYSAKDVEDLVEVQKVMITKLSTLLQDLVNIQNPEVINILWKKACKTYSLHGCCSIS